MEWLINLSTLPRAVGSCDGIESRWTYNSETAQCEGFEWGTCGVRFIFIIYIYIY